MNETDPIPNLFRTEYGRMVAVLCRIFGIENIQVAEDLVSETFLLAAETWGKKGIPKNQVAWLYAVAKNKARDHLRRNSLFYQKVEPDIKRFSKQTSLTEYDWSSEYIEDEQLKMIFAICHPDLPAEAQIGLALRILCGFGVQEIADAFLVKTATITKRLYRARIHLRAGKVSLDLPNQSNLDGRLDNVLRVIYLMFNEGYFSSTPDKTLRKDFCLEAMRLCLILTHHSCTNLPKVNALLALMCFHASRFEARVDSEGGLVLYEDQDRSQWNLELVAKGEYYLNLASTGDQMSKYHLEAAIAYWHTSNVPNKWSEILKLYNYLLQVEYSPMAALNRTYALAMANGVKEALQSAQMIDLEDHFLYQILMAELYKEIETKKARFHLEKAMCLAKSDGERIFVTRKMSRL